ncbi:amino acid transporter AVT3B-like [Arachis duranensis]|uniref:Amino acid transporter AVT3B-like n=2 Tax=Arachis TaxID=3817 RepID=A0A6P4CLK0_ARADU|nr:amino acid transporter AVT3B-like [Arachis duranensis]XP_052117599.1 amino acid transporter AVT3B-like [Arachis duranensis]
MGLQKKNRTKSSSSSAPNEDTPLLGGHYQPLSSKTKTFANIFIAIVGAGVLGLPYCFKKTGWILGLIMLFTVGFFTHYCMILLVQTRRKLESSFSHTISRGSSKINSFGDLGYAIWGPFGKSFVDFMIVLSQFSFCVGYLIFVSTTLAYLSKYDSILGLTPKVLIHWACFPFQLALNAIPTLTHLAPLSIFADIVDFAAKSVVMIEDVFICFENRPNLKAFGGFPMFFYGIGVAVYAFEGIGMVLPLESEAKDKEKFGDVLGLAMMLISILYGSFGALGYFAFGDETQEIITTNFGQGLISDLVQFCLCINLFFTFPLMMNPVYEVIEGRFCDSRYCLWMRWLMVLGVSLVAIFVPNFTDFLSLVGSSVCVILSFVMPALFHLVVFKEELGLKCVVRDGVIMFFGFVIAVSGTWSSLLEIFENDV